MAQFSVVSPSLYYVIGVWDCEGGYHAPIILPAALECSNFYVGNASASKTLHDAVRGPQCSWNEVVPVVRLPPAITVEPTSMAITTTTRVATIAARTARATAATNASVVLDMTGTTASTNSTRGGRSAAVTSTGTYVINPARDAKFEGIRLRPGMRQLLQANPPPHNDANAEFCVSWWGRGGCYSNFGRAATHRPFSNAAEREQRLLAHVRTHFMAPVAAPAAGTRRGGQGAAAVSAPAPWLLKAPPGTDVHDGDNGGACTVSRAEESLCKY